MTVSERIPYRVVVVVGILCLAPAVLYFSWCWGWWGRGSLWMQYLLQCNCPLSSEPARYPAEVDVLVSACQRGNVAVSPGGTSMLVRPDAPGDSYLWDLTTGTRQLLPTPGYYSFVTDDVLWVSPPGAREQYLFNWRTQTASELTELWSPRVPGGERADGTPNAEALLPLLRSTDQVYLPDTPYLSDEYVLVLGGQLVAGADRRNFLISRWAWVDRAASDESLRAFLEEQGIAYHLQRTRYSVEWPSPTGRYVARTDGIFLAATGERIASMEGQARRGFGMRGWLFDERGFVMDGYPDYLIDLYIIEASIRLGRVDHPVLVLQVPSEYLP